MMYKNKRTGKIAKVIEEPNDKYKTIMLQEVDSDKSFVITTSTLKRWYVQVDDEDSSVVSVSDIVNEEDVVSAEANEHMCEPDEVLTTTVKTSETAVSVGAVEFAEVLDYIDRCAADRGMTYYIREKQLNVRNYKLPDVKNVVFAVVSKKHSVELHCKTKLLPEELYSKMEPVKHCFNCKYVITELTTHAEQFVMDIINNIKA